MSAPAVLDVCCGGRMMWSDKRDSRAIFGVRRSETITVTDRSHGHDGRMFSKSQQVFFIGNAVPPLLQKVVTEANYRDLEPLRAAA